MKEKHHSEGKQNAESKSGYRYYSKSPEELKKFLNIKDQKRIFNPFRNRTTLIIFLDILLIFIIFGTLKYSGYMDGGIHGIREISYRELTLFSTLLVPSGDTAIRSKEEATLYLNVKNNSSIPLTFPSQNGPYQIKSVEFEVGDAHHLTSIPLLLPAREIANSQVEIYRMEISLPESVMDKQRKSTGFWKGKETKDYFQIRISTPDGILIVPVIKKKM